MTTDIQGAPSTETLLVQAIGALRAARDSSFFRLKRGSTLLDAMMEPVFHRVMQELKEQKYFVSNELLAAALLLLARVDERALATPLAVALRKKDYADLRFRQIVQAETPDELFTHLQRALRYCEGRACPFDLTRTVLGWTDARMPQTRIRLMNAFYGFVS